MSSRPAIKVDRLSKEFMLGERERYFTLRESLQRAVGYGGGGTAKAARPSNRMWALDDVSFEVEPGDVVGIIGHNGAGKSTLLKILSRITEPSKGVVELFGRVSSLLEVGTGFHPELTGRENIYLNGSILGMRKREIDAKFDEIVAFSGVEKFLDMPVKRYSSGMSVRLAFSVAAHLEPEILLIDEVLAVGDAEFQRKCLGKMNDVANSGRTVLFVSHNMAAVEGLCTRAILLEAGRLVSQGEVGDVTRRYLLARSTFECCVDATHHPNRVGGSQTVIERVEVLNGDGKPAALIGMGDPITFVVRTRFDKPVPGQRIGIHINSWLGQRVTSAHSAYQSLLELSSHGRSEVRCTIPHLDLMPGEYSLTVGIAAAGAQVDRIDPAIHFQVIPRDVFGTGRLPAAQDGVFFSRANWEVRQAAAGEVGVSEVEREPS